MDPGGAAAAIAAAGLGGLVAAAAAAPPAPVTNWRSFDDTVQSLKASQRGLAADLVTEGSPLDAHATHSLGISPAVSDRLFLTLGLGQTSGADDGARVASWATALQNPWVCDILDSVRTIPAEYPTFRLQLDSISAEMQRRLSAPAMAPGAPGHLAGAAPGVAPGVLGAPGTAKIAFYNTNRLTYRQLPAASVSLVAADRDFQSGALAASKLQDFPAAARDLHPKPAISQNNHLVNKLVHMLTEESAEKNKDILKGNPELQAVQEGILNYHAVLISQIASVLSTEGLDGRTVTRDYTPVEAHVIFLLVQALDHDMIFDNLHIFSSDRFLARRRVVPKRDHGVQTGKLTITELEDCYAGFCAAARVVWGIRVSTNTNGSAGALKRGWYWIREISQHNQDAALYDGTNKGYSAIFKEIVWAIVEEWTIDFKKELRHEPTNTAALPTVTISLATRLEQGFAMTKSPDMFWTWSRVRYHIQKWCEH